MALFFLYLKYEAYKTSYKDVLAIKNKNGNHHL